MENDDEKPRLCAPLQMEFFSFSISVSRPGQVRSGIHTLVIMRTSGEPILAEMPGLCGRDKEVSRRSEENFCPRFFF